MELKTKIKSWLRYIPFDISVNQAYDRQTWQIIKKVCDEDACCVDIGCHKGEIMDWFIQCSPNGNHWGFEPIPSLYEGLQKKYHHLSQVAIYPFALSDKAGRTQFNYVVNHPAYSGILKRKYDHADAKVEIIEVELRTLDSLMEDVPRIDLIKIDVEGAELQVLNGARQLLERTHPVVIFEHGLGASDFYGTQPEQVWDLFHALRYQVFTMQAWLSNQAAMDKMEFGQQFYQKSNYYFVAVPKTT